MRIYSFIPSATEMVYALGLGGQVCGVTHECDYPPEAREKPVAVRSLVDTSGLSQREIDDVGKACGAEPTRRSSSDRSRLGSRASGGGLSP